jgi:fatty-acyl-CoA synthase
VQGALELGDHVPICRVVEGRTVGFAVPKGPSLDVVNADPEALRIEAVATTFWFGFKDDVVVRVRPGAAGGSRVDVRSVSRVGQSDLGANAARIRRILDGLQGA